MIVLDLIRSSLRMSGGLRTGQSITTDDSTEALLVLNAMISGWNTKRLNLFTERRDLYTLVASQAAYTIGTGGNFNATRPNKITRAGFMISSGVSAIEQPLKILLTAQEWADVALKGLPSSIPYQMYCDYAHPLANIYFNPVPTGTNQVALYTWQALSAFTSTAQSISLPDGYEDAIRYNLAVRIAVEWGRELNNKAEVRRLASETLAAIQSLNSPDYVMDCDPAVTGETNGNWYGPRRGLFF